MYAVTDRFFQAYAAMLAMGEITTEGFCRELGVDKRNFYKQRDDHTRCILKTHWLTHVVERHGVSPKWLLTGKGDMFYR